jgi:outer membrane protein assembly factor BamD
MGRMLLSAIMIAIIFVGCAEKDKVTEYNKPASYWYQKIVESIVQTELEKADEYFISLRSEHVSSPLLPTAIMMLAHAHMDENEYLLANYYFDEYNKRFATSDELEYSDFMKLKSAFFGIVDVNKDQKLILDTAENSTKFTARYPGSVYKPLNDTISVRLNMSQYLLNENVAALYDRTGKKEAAKIYRQKNSQSALKMSDIEMPEQGFVGKIID